VKRLLTLEAEKLNQLADAEDKAAANCSTERKVPSRPTTVTSKIINYGKNNSDLITSQEF